jgi:alanine racemase
LDNQITWAEINLDAYAHNIRELIGVTQPPARLMAVVKANGYGHGAVEVAREALQSGARYLGVARINEAIPLREAGLEVPILIFGYSPPGLAPMLIDYELTQTVYSLSTASALSEQATRKGEKINVHLKVDSGMGRLGFLLVPTNGTSRDIAAQNPVREIEANTRLPGLTV